MRKIGTGRTAEVFLTDDHTALKLFYDWVSPEHIAHEVSRAETIGSLYPEAPCFIRTGQWDGRPGLEMEYIEGEMGTDHLARNPLGIRQLLEQVAATHKDMHAMEAPALPGQMEKFGPALEQSSYLTDLTRSALVRFLQEKGDMPYLCHGDFHPENILVTAEGRFRVIDWLDAYRGDPMGDVARTYYLLSSAESPQPTQRFTEKMMMRMRPILVEQYFRYYYRGEKIFEKDWLTWQLIVQTARIEEGIEKEIPMLHQRIRILEERLHGKPEKPPRP